MCSRAVRAQVFLLSMALGCGVNPKDWGDERLRVRIAALRPDLIAGASIALDECPRRPLPITQETLVELLRQIPRLVPAPDIGIREEWKEWRIISIKTAAGEAFEINVSTRESLAGKAIVVLEEDPSGGIGFYSGEEFWKWLQRTPESLALESPQVEPAPCT